MENLQYGSRGDRVSQLQTQLNNWGFPLEGPPLKVDGNFGDKTLNAVIQFQKSKGLKPDGIVGDKTWEALWVSRYMKGINITSRYMSVIESIKDFLENASEQSFSNPNDPRLPDSVTPNTVPILREALKDKDEFVRSIAVYALGEIGSKARDALPDIQEALQDKDWAVRYSAAIALVQVSGWQAKAAIPVLIEALQPDKIEEVRQSAVDALVEIRQEALAAVPALRVVVQKDKSEKVRKSAADAIKSITNPQPQSPWRVLRNAMIQYLSRHKRGA